MKRKLCAAVMLLLFLLSSCAEGSLTANRAQDASSNAQTPQLKTITHVDWILYDDFDELVDRSDLIMTAKVVSESERDIPGIDRSSGTEKTFELEHIMVLKGILAGNAGCRVSQKTLYYKEDQLLHPGETRLFFLNKTDIVGYYSLQPPEVGYPIVENDVIRPYPGNKLLADNASLTEVKSMILESVRDSKKGNETIPHMQSIERVLTVPAPDMTVEHQIPCGIGCYTAKSLEALTCLLQTADGALETLLPHESLDLTQAIVRGVGTFDYLCADSETGCTLLYRCKKGNLDISPWEEGWEKCSLNNKTYYKLVKSVKGIEGKVICLSMQTNGWTFLLQVFGPADNAAVKRYLSMRETVFNSEKTALKADAPLIASETTLERLLSERTDLAFEQHANAYYSFLGTQNVNMLEEFLFHRLGKDGYYLYSSDDDDQTEFNAEDDGKRITLLCGDVKGDDYLSFSYSTHFCPSFAQKLNIYSEEVELIGAGAFDIDGTTYHYRIEKNYKKYNTEIFWTRDGISFHITERRSWYKTQTQQTIRGYLSHIRYVSK